MNKCYLLGLLMFATTEQGGVSVKAFCARNKSAPPNAHAYRRPVLGIIGSVLMLFGLAKSRFCSGRILIGGVRICGIISSLSVLLLCGLSGSATAAPGIKIGEVLRIQPGWVRVYLLPTDAPAGATYQAVATCAVAADAGSITTTVMVGANIAVDIKINPAWLTDNDISAPCTVTQIVANMYRPGTVPAAEVIATVSIPMDLPLSLLTPGNTTMRPTGTSVSLTPSTTYAAYPPLIVVVQDKVQNISFIEVEALPTRQTVGLRGMTTFSKVGSTYNPVFELGGGGELQDQWGLDNLGLGIWQSPQLPVEISNPGHDVFPYTGTAEPPLLSGDTSLKIYPAPPLFTAADYQANVLDNRGVKRCLFPTGCMVVQYSLSLNVLKAVNGATIGILAPPAIVVGTQSNPPVNPIVIAAPRSLTTAVGTGAVLRDIDSATAARLLDTASALAATPGRNLVALQDMPTALAGAASPVSTPGSTRDYSTIEVSPQEEEIGQLPFYSGGPSTSPSKVVTSCAVNATLNGLTESPSPCAGMDGGTFACPTVGKPIKVDELGPPTATAVSLYGTIPPYYFGRDNVKGTCGSHAYTQYVEALYDKFSDDLAVKRVIYVNGDPIVVPDPRVALSVSGGLAQWELWDGTHTGDPPGVVGYSASGSNGTMPNFPEAFQPAREGDWNAWNAAAIKTKGNANLCLKTGTANGLPTSWQSFWKNGFCLAQGHAGPGVYYSHSLQVQNLNNDPLADPPWSLANHWFNIVSTAISLADRDAAIQSVIAEINGGLPVNLSFSSGQTKATTFATISSGPTWYLPPELAGCTTEQLDGVLGRDDGHVVNIMGFWIAGSPTKPDPVNSYFMLENNWGKTNGYHSFYFMNFAAFRYLATGLTTFRLDRTCGSAACARQAPRHMSDLLRAQLLYPPDPKGPNAAAYEAALAAIHSSLGGATEERNRPRE
jgi:hypothetical protein